MTAYCCSVHPDQAVSWRGTGCQLCVRDKAAARADDKPRRARDELGERLGNLRSGRLQ